MGEGEAILFLHGNASRWQHWDPQLAAFSGRYRCAAFDQRGFGASSPLRGTSLTQMADDTAALCATLEIGRAVAVGLSMGGGVAEVLAARHPALVTGLVVAARWPMPRAMCRSTGGIIAMNSWRGWDERATDPIALV